MTLDRKHFAGRMLLLGERFNRAVSKPLLAAYYAQLSPAFGSNAEFDDAFERMFRSAKFFPSPEEILEAGEPVRSDDDELTALALLQEAYGFTQCSHGRGQVNRRDVFRSTYPNSERLIATLEQTIGLDWTCYAIHEGLRNNAGEFQANTAHRITEAVIRAAVAALRHHRRQRHDLLTLNSGGPASMPLLAAPPDHDEEPPV